MSTKTIAVESNVYNRLAGEKRESESFTKVIARLLNTAAAAHTGGSIAAALADLRPLSDGEAQQMLAVVQEGRAGEKWERHDLR